MKDNKNFSVEYCCKSCNQINNFIEEVNYNSMNSMRPDECQHFKIKFIKSMDKFLYIIKFVCLNCDIKYQLNKPIKSKMEEEYDLKCQNCINEIRFRLLSINETTIDEGKDNNNNNYITLNFQFGDGNEGLKFQKRVSIDIPIKQILEEFKIVDKRTIDFIDNLDYTINSNGVSIDITSSIRQINKSKNKEILKNNDTLLIPNFKPENTYCSSN